MGYGFLAKLFQANVELLLKIDHVNKVNPLVNITSILTNVVVQKLAKSHIMYFWGFSISLNEYRGR